MTVNITQQDLSSLFSIQEDLVKKMTDLVNALTDQTAILRQHQESLFSIGDTADGISKAIFDSRVREAIRMNDTSFDAIGYLEKIFNNKK